MPDRAMYVVHDIRFVSVLMEFKSRREALSFAKEQSTLAPSGAVVLIDFHSGPTVETIAVAIAGSLFLKAEGESDD